MIKFFFKFNERDQKKQRTLKVVFFNDLFGNPLAFSRCDKHTVGRTPMSGLTQNIHL